MISKIEWPHSGFDLRSPFDRGKNERPIKLTFDSRALKGVKGVEADALSILYELSHFDIVSALIFDGDEFPRITFSESGGERDYSSITIIGTDGESMSRHEGIDSGNIDDNSIIEIMGVYSSNKHDELINTREIVIPVEAHFALQRDIFITTSPFLLSKQHYFKYENVRTPLEALKIVGLFLRSRNDWSYRVTKRSRFHSSRDYFYWTLARSGLSKIAVFSLSETIIKRCSRALQARDEIGKLFYSYGEHDLGDQVLYHYDYLNILLVGALDAVAAALNEKYNLVKSNSDRGFTRKKFRKSLSLSLPKLSEFLESTSNEILLEIVSELRNTVHSKRLSSKGRLVIELPEVLRDKLWDKSKEHSDSNNWGLAYEKYDLFDGKNKTLIPKYRITLEPYTYAVYLTDHWIKLLNSIAEIVREQQSSTEINFKYALSEPELDYVRRVSLLG